MQHELQNKLYSFFTQRPVYHGLSWLGLFLLLFVLDGTQQGVVFTLVNEVINVVFYAAIVYFNLLYLIPHYLTKNRFLTYIALLVTACAVITPLKIVVFYFRFWDLPQMQDALVRNQGWYFLSNLFIATSSTIFNIISDWAKQQRRSQELENQTMQSELRFLKSQINPHFLFNTLNNLYALTLKKSDEAPEIVIKLSEMMRYMLYECNEKRVLLSKEVNYLQNYLDLERLRQGKDTEINFTVSGHISNQQIAPLMFIPFLENSFKHGLNHLLAKGFVNISLSADEHYVQFHIENSKPDTQPMRDHQRPSGGIGLVNVHRRLSLLYPDRYELHIEDSPNVYAVTLSVELD